MSRDKSLLQSGAPDDVVDVSAHSGVRDSRIKFPANTADSCRYARHSGARCRCRR